MHVPRHLQALCLVLLFALSGAAVQAQTKPGGSHTASGTPIRDWVDGVPDTGQFLPDTAVLATVAGRPITVGQFIGDYFDVYAPVRPKTDSAGRAEFLQTLVDKLVLGEVVRPMPFNPGFEQRATLRAYTARVLSNVLYQRAVLDSSVPSEAMLRDFYEKLKQEVRVQRIRLLSPSEAARVRADLVAGRITWRRAVAEHSAEKLADPDGDIGWANLYGLSEPMASLIADLKVGAISEPIRTTDGTFLFRRVGTRPFSPPSYEGIRQTLYVRLRNHLSSQRAERLQRRLVAEHGIVVDTANVRFASAFYQPHVTSERKDGGVNAVTINVDVPHFEPADNQRVLARWPGGQYTLGEFNHALGELNPMMRPTVHEPDLMAEQVELLALEPFRAELAAARGLEKDSMAVAMIGARIEQFKVEAMIEDSVMSRVLISDAERRAYYAAHPREYTSFPRIRFAAFSAPTRAAGDSLAAVIRGGRRAEDILLADSLAGIKRGSIQTRSRNEPGPFHKLMFDDMRPGQVRVEGPGTDQTFFVLQLLEYDPGQLLPYEQVLEFVDNQLRAQREEERYQQFMQRQRARFPIVAHHDRLPLVKLVAPEL